MTETIPAVFENGVFRPLRRPRGPVEEPLSALAEVTGSLSAEDAQELREIIDSEFERVDPREW